MRENRSSSLPHRWKVRRHDLPCMVWKLLLYTPTVVSLSMFQWCNLMFWVGMRVWFNGISLWVCAVVFSARANRAQFWSQQSDICVVAFTVAMSNAFLITVLTGQFVNITGLFVNIICHIWFENSSCTRRPLFLYQCSNYAHWCFRLGCGYDSMESVYGRVQWCFQLERTELSFEASKATFAPLHLQLPCPMRS